MNKTNVPRANKNSSNVRSGLLSIIGIVILIILVAIVLSGCGSKTTKIELSNYISADLSGYNEYGSVELSIDYEKMLEDIRASKLAKQKALEIIDNYPPFDVEYETSDFLKNKDVVKVAIKRNRSASDVEEKLKINFSGRTYEYVVEGLGNVEDCDIFQYLTMNSNGTVSGAGSAEFKIEYYDSRNTFTWNVDHNAKDGEMKNGDVIMLTINDDIDEDAFIRATGKRLISKTCEFEVWGLGQYAIGDDMIQRLIRSNVLKFDKVIDDWVVSCLNDGHIHSEKRTYRKYGYIYYTSNVCEIEQDEEGYGHEVVNDPTESMLITVYKIKDPLINDEYYVFIGLEGVFSYDDDIICVDGEELPESFMYYEKEKARFDPVEGWTTDEKMAFMHGGVAYAGHKEIEDTLNYVEDTYGKDYKYFYATDYLNDLLIEMRGENIGTAEETENIGEAELAEEVAEAEIAEETEN